MPVYHGLVCPCTVVLGRWWYVWAMSGDTTPNPTTSAKTPATILDVLIIGGGPAGLTAGIYAGRGNLSTVIIEKGQPGRELPRLP
jgi:hypothetical protein